MLLHGTRCKFSGCDQSRNTLREPQIQFGVYQNCSRETPLNPSHAAHASRGKPASARCCVQTCELVSELCPSGEGFGPDNPLAQCSAMSSCVLQVLLQWKAIHGLLCHILPGRASPGCCFASACLQRRLHPADASVWRLGDQATLTLLMI
jgi:hypothetical protein